MLFVALLALVMALGAALVQPIAVVRGQDPPAVTVQDGDLNYAGPASGCPGPEWNCVTSDALPVVQTGTQNVIIARTQATCVPANAQTGPSNYFECSLDDTAANEPTARQDCAVTQTGGGTNVAICKLTHVSTSGPVQCAVQVAEIHQTGADNQLKIDMRIVQQTKTGTNQLQDARQVVRNTTQNATQKNQSDIEQVQIQEASGSAITQRQNTGCVGASQPAGEPDCAPPGFADAGQGPTSPYTCVNLEQEVPAGGQNISKLKQEVKEQAVTTAPGALQEQGTFVAVTGGGLDATGGNEGRIHQGAPSVVSEDSVILAAGSEPAGKNVMVADQYTYQTAVAPNGDGLLVDPAVQRQFEDPICCSRRSQEGGTDNQIHINQWVQQQADEGAVQEARAIAIDSQDGDGYCTANQTVENGGGTREESVTLEPCEELFMETACASVGVASGCFSTEDEENGG